MAVYIRYEIKNLEPLRIADDSSSHMGQTSTLHYIPGTTLRGLVINRMSQREKFSELKGKLFSNKIRFLNAYPLVRKGNQAVETIPSPKGFYESKFKEVKKPLENVLVSDISMEGLKRAAVGEFAWVEKDDDTGDLMLRCMRIPTGSDLKIKININSDDEQTVFRNEYMAAGNTFVGYVAVEEESDLEWIEEILREDLILGNARSSGLGKCILSAPSVISGEPFGEYAETEELTGFCYMMLMSHTVMRDCESGEYCGINTAELSELLGVTELEIDKCATSVVDVRGYNRKWGVRIPSVTMYEKGSVFKLKFQGNISKECILKTMNQGIGVRRNEGFGRVIFLKDYDKIKYRKDYSTQGQELASHVKAEISENEVSGVSGMDDNEITTLRAAAKNYYRNIFRTSVEKYVVDLNWDRGDVSSSKIAKIEAFTTAFRFDYKKAQQNIEKYFAHARDKQKRERVQHYKHSDISDLDRYVTDVLGWSLTDMEEELGISTKDCKRVMGIPKTDEAAAGEETGISEMKGLFTEEEIGRMKLELLTRVIRFEHRKGN